IYLVTSSTIRQSVRATLASGVTAAIIFLPFLVQDRHTITEMLQTMANRDTYVSGNAHNFWWLVSSIAGIDPKMDDSSPALAGLPYSVVSTVIVVTLYAMAATFLVRKRPLRLT